jgi:hypothetical protein
MDLLNMLNECVDEDDEEEVLFKQRLLEFLQNLKEEYGAKNNGVV